MNKFLFLILFLFAEICFSQNLKISQLPPITEAELATNDVFPIVDTNVDTTKKVSIGELDLRWGASANAITSLTGDVTGTGPGATATTIANGAVTNAKVASGAGINFSKMENVAGLSVIGVTGNSSAAPSGITAGTDNYVLRRSGTSLAFGLLSNSNLTGTAGITNSNLALMANNTLKGNISGGSAAPSDLTASQVTAMLLPFVGDSGSGGTQGLVPAPGTGDASKCLTGAGTWGACGGGTYTFNDTNSIDLTNSANTITADLKLSAASPDSGYINTTNSIETDGLQIQVPIATTSTTGVLTDTDWDTFNGKQPAGNYITGLTGDVVATGPGSVSATIQNGVVSNSMLSNMPDGTFKGNVSGSTGPPDNVTVADVTAALNDFIGDSGSGGLKGLVPAPAAGDAAANKYLKSDGTWTTPSGSGDVAGPASSTDSGFARFDGTSGKLLKNSAATISNSDVASNADINFTKLEPLSSGNILVGNGSNDAASVAMSGAITISNSGVTSYNGIVPLSTGGTNKNMTAVAGGLVYTDADSQEVSAAGTTGQYAVSGGTGAPTWASFASPKITVYISGSGTFTTSTSPATKYIIVRMVGGGGGGGSAGTTAANNAAAGGNGSASTFGTSLLIAGGGGGGNSLAGGAGGAPSVQSPAVEIASAFGAYGGSSTYISGAAGALIGGPSGGNSVFSGAGYGGTAASNNGVAARANSGSGGGSAFVGGTGFYSNGSGGAAAYVEALIPIGSVSSTYAYTVGSAGSAGSPAGAGAAGIGGAGGAGKIIVMEFFQ